MGQYEVRHQCDKTCGTCAHYSTEIYEDKSGPYIDEICDMDHIGKVGYFTEACNDYKED